MIIQNPLTQKTLKPAQALELGIADALFGPAAFLEDSLVWAASVLNGQTTVERPEVDRSEMWDAVTGFARQQLDEKVHGAPPAPYRALKLLRLAKTASYDEGIAAEEEALADLIMSDSARASLYGFDLIQRRAKRPVGAPSSALARDVTKVGIVGAGLMAGQIALLFARRLEVPVVLTDLDATRVDKGVGYVHGEIDKLVAKKRLTADKAQFLKGLVTGDVDKGAFADADLVIEAVFEELGVKKQVWAEVEKIVSPTCVLATNTSSLSVTAMAQDLEHPERVVGFHFFNPVAIMPLLEIIRAEKTDDPTLATAFAVGKQLKKSCVLVKDAPSFVVNRLLTRFLGAVFAAVDAGTPLAVANEALDPLGLPMRPLTLLTMVGPAVAKHVARDAARGVPGPLPGQREPGPDRGGRQAAHRPGRRDRSVSRGHPGLRRQPADRRAGTRPGARRPGHRSPADAGRGGCGRSPGHRPVHDPGCRLAALQRRRHPVPGPRRRLRPDHRSPLPPPGPRQRPSLTAPAAGPGASMLPAPPSAQLDAPTRHRVPGRPARPRIVESIPP